MDGAKQPLAGRCVVVTRAPEQAADPVAALERLGAEVVLMPTVEFAPPEDWQLLDAQLRKLEAFDAILFTSKNAVRYILARCRSLGIRCETFSGARLIAAVGPGTAQAAKEDGLRVDYVAKNHTGEALARELASELRGRRVLLPRSDRADDRLPAALREADAEVTEVVAYRTTAPKAIDPQALERLRRAQVDAVIFASPSAFHNLSAWIPAGELAALAQRVQFAAIGPTTARALREAGARVEIEAADTSAAALADAIAGYYQKQSAAVRHT
jgi:uroporphyrinogen III methyltransferase/synthase